VEKRISSSFILSPIARGGGKRGESDLPLSGGDLNDSFYRGEKGKEGRTTYANEKESSRYWLSVRKKRRKKKNFRWISSGVERGGTISLLQGKGRGGRERGKTGVVTGVESHLARPTLKGGERDVPEMKPEESQKKS